jgi:hypothetical protein
MRRRRRPKRDMTPCTVVVAPNTLVYWQGQQRGGTLTDVPKWQAMAWLRSRFVVYVLEPVGAGGATCSPARSGADERRANRSPAASPPQPPTVTGEGAQQTQQTTQPTTHPDPADESQTAADTTTPDKSAGRRGTSPSRRLPGYRNGAGDFGPFRSQGFGPPVAQQPAGTAAELGEQPDDGRGEGARTRTQPVRNPYGPGRCPNCGSRVTGRRKWCDEACRLQAYRARQR